MKTLINLSVLLLMLTVPNCQDTAVSEEVAKQLESPVGLNFPKSVKRFYAANSSQAIWLQEDTKTSRTWSSMLLLDCVLQFGLSHDDYHPDKLLYPKLREMLKDPKKTTAKDKATFEIYLTDALITLINDLHFGKANPSLSRYQIDQGNIPEFNAETVLKNALTAKDFAGAVLDVQPKSKAYLDLQKYMTLIRGQYLDDCYAVPEAEARKVAINMERLKWNVVTAKSYIEVNIPAYTLTYYLPDTSFTFKVIVGKPEKPTPVLQSAISYIGIAPDWKVPHTMFTGKILTKAIADPGFLEREHYTIYDQNGKLVSTDRATLEKIKKSPKGFVARQSSGCELTLGRMAFHFPNNNGIYLYDGQQEKLFQLENRTLSNSCVGIQHAEQLAKLLLKYDGQESLVPEMFAASTNYSTKNLILKKPVVLDIAYQTCTVRDGLLVTYPDPYEKDKALERDMYGNGIMLAKK